MPEGVLGVDKITGAGWGAAKTEINFAGAFDGPSVKKLSIAERKRAQQEKLAKQKIQEYETQRAKAAAQEGKIKGECAAEAAAFREVSKNYETYLSRLQENYFATAKQDAINNAKKTRTGHDRDNYLAMIENLQPFEFYVQPYLSAEEAKILANYKAALATARQNLSSKLSILLGPEAKRHSGQVDIFRYINELIYVPPPVETATQVASKP
jgi:hypothetical protein